ncbi:MAG: thiamine pyrophosphate-dependent enzyme, partial [Acidimicrobiales bacterium]|nr:thiamine pyrophosphate-dependent enzyme [Acidimicrobiales bacterium]
GVDAALIAVAKHPEQRRLARDLGADVVCEPGELAGVVRRHSNSLQNGAQLTGGADHVLDCVGSSDSIQQSLQVVAPGGTIHLVVNNQVGFTTSPGSSRSSLYCTDVARMVQAPIFHVNGDDPEAVVRVARLASGFRQRFHKDVVIDMVCYRRHGHNEGDDPSFTQPLMYKAIMARRSVRKLYTETLVKRGDISMEDAERALDDFLARMQVALEETRHSAPPVVADTAPPPVPESLQSVATGVSRQVLDRVATAMDDTPAGFSVHPKLLRTLQSRRELYDAGEVDWSMGEALAFGSLLVEGTDIRLSGQDSRRGTFSQRHQVLVDYETGAEWLPLSELARGGGKLWL